MQEFRWF